MLHVYASAPSHGPTQRPDAFSHPIGFSAPRVASCGRRFLIRRRGPDRGGLQTGGPRLAGLGGAPEDGPRWRRARRGGGLRGSLPSRAPAMRSTRCSPSMGFRCWRWSRPRSCGGSWRRSAMAGGPPFWAGSCSVPSAMAACASAGRWSSATSGRPCSTPCGIRCTRSQLSSP